MVTARKTLKRALNDNFTAAFGCKGNSYLWTLPYPRWAFVEVVPWPCRTDGVMRLLMYNIYMHGRTLMMHGAIWDKQEPSNDGARW
jgi:hypothetical protein